MEGNHMYLYKDLLDEYYRCLETIENKKDSKRDAYFNLRMCERKLEEGKQLVKSFGFSDQDINKLPSLEIQKKQLHYKMMRF